MPKLLSMNAYHYIRGGSQAVCFEQAEMFERHGWDTAFFAMHHPDNLPSPWSRFFVREVEMGQNYSFWQKASMAQQIIYSREHARAIDALLDAFPADIAHVHGIHHHIAANIYRTLQKRGVRVVLTAHDLKLLCPAYRMHDGSQVCESCKPNALHHCTLKRCVHGSLALSGLVTLESAAHRMLGYYRKDVNRIVCPSRFYLEKHAEWGWPREKLVYIPNSVDLPTDQNISAPGDYLCYFGRLSYEKGMPTVIRAAAEAKMRLEIVGEGPQEAELRMIAAESGADVIFHGRKSGDALFSIVRNARACVLASEWYENAPKSILEAFGLGKIVIGADIGGIPEMIGEGETGFLFPSGDQAALAKTIRHVAAMADDKIVDMGGMARDFARKEFTKDRYFERMQTLYSELGVRSDIHP